MRMLSHPQNDAHIKGILILTHREDKKNENQNHIHGERFGFLLLRTHRNSNRNVHHRNDLEGDRMTRFIEMPFSELPEKSDYYLLVRKDDCGDLFKHRGKFDSLEYCTEGGWNTYKDHNGDVYTDAEITIEQLEENHKCWLKPVTVGEYRWAEAMSDLIDEIKAKVFDYADCKLTEDEEDMVDKLQTMIDHLGEAMEIAQEFKE